MKFAIRDDDLNYFYTPDEIERNMEDIWDICPVSMSAVPFIKGNWVRNRTLLEEVGSSNLSEDMLSMIKEDAEIFKIGNNRDLIEYIKRRIIERKIYITLHAIHHRNEDEKLPFLANNFSIGAEFYTDRDLTEDLRISKEYMEELVGQKIEVFTPPQNVLSLKGWQAVINNQLKICATPPSIRYSLYDCISLIGVKNFLNYFLHRLRHKGVPFPFVMKTKKLQLVDHCSLQPRSNIEELYDRFNQVYKMGGDFVLSTHSYGFAQKMAIGNMTMGDVLREFLDYVSRKAGVDFVTLDKVFEKNK